MGRKGWVSDYHLGSQLSPDTSHSLVTHLLRGLVETLHPVMEAALGPGACFRLSRDLGAEEGGV